MRFPIRSRRNTIPQKLGLGPLRGEDALWRTVLTGEGCPYRRKKRRRIVIVSAGGYQAVRSKEFRG